MLDSVDRVQLAVRDREAAAATFADILGAEKASEDVAENLNARRTVVQAGDSQFELLEPAGEGAVSQHLERWGEGLFAAGFATSDLGDIARRMEDTGLHFSYEDTEVYIDPEQTMGMRATLRVSEPRDRVGFITGLYEVTHIVEDHEQAAAFYAGIFGLDRSRFSPIKSEEFGYTGTLTLFDPPAKLDRIELTQITQPSLAMGRFFARRGPSLYMCFVETEDIVTVRDRLQARGARFADFADRPEAGLFIHPSALCGMLMGVSFTNVAWRWSGRPELAPRFDG